MKVSDINKSLATMTILVDTREQPTAESKNRYKQFGCPYSRRKLNFGDYSAEVTLPNGEVYCLAKSVAVERKMSIDELAMCFTRDRGRFEREFERASEAEAKLYLLIENADWAKIYLHYYRSKMTTPSLIGSILAFGSRYEVQTMFCPPMFSGRLIADILKFEMRERLKDYEYV